MAKVHEIGIGADTRPFEDNIKRGVIKPAEDAEKALEKLGDTDAGKDAARDLDKMEDALREAQRQTEQLKDSVDDVGDKSRRSFDKAKEGAEEFKDEANSTAREAAASFDGSAESIADMFQEVAANAFAGFGPAGAIAGLAAAAGIGLAVAGFEDVNKSQERAAELASEWADRFVESGQRVATAAQQSAAIVDISTDPEKYKEATENAKLWGVETTDAMLAMAGNVGAIKVVEDALDRKREATEKDAAAAQQAAEDNGSALLALTPQEVELGKAEGAWRKHTDAMTEGSRQADDASNSLLRLIESEKTATQATDDLGNKLITLPDNTEIVIDAKTGQATLDVSKFKTDTDGVIDHVNGRDVVIKARADLSEAESAVRRFLERTGNETFTIYGQAVTDYLGGRKLP